jgi:alanine racemase
MSVMRPAWVEIDLDALASNARAMRGMIGPDCFFFAVVKGDGYGIGTVEAGRVLADAGADGLALGDPADAAALRGAGLTLPILLYATTLPEQAAEVASLGVIPTIHDMPGLLAFAALGRTLDVYVKLDCGVGRIGFLPHEWDAAFAALRAAPSLRVAGVYSHFRAPDDMAALDAQAALFAAGVASATEAGHRGFRTMVSSSRILVGRPDLNLTAVNPGKGLFGHVDASWPHHAALRPVVAGLKARVIQVKAHPAGSHCYGGTVPLAAARRFAVVPMGYMDGLNFDPPGHVALLRGRRVPVVAKRGSEHMVLDVTHLPDAAVGDEVAFVGRQGGDEITMAELAGVVGVPAMELAGRVARMAPRRYLPVRAAGRSVAALEAPPVPIPLAALT